MRYFLCLSFVALTACASHGHNFSIDQANRVTNGMTREEVIRIMGGKPNSVANGGKTFIWSFAKANFIGGTESRAVKFTFDDDGKAVGIPAGGVYGDAKKYQ